MLTPRVSSTGGAFTNVYPASGVLCRRLGTVSETSGSRYPLADSDCHSLARAHFRSRIDPGGQNRACAERFRNSAAHDPEHLPSYHERSRFYPFARYHPLGCPREAGDTAYPFAHPLCRDAPSRAPRFRASYVEPTRALRQASPLDQRYVRSTNCNPTCQKQALVVSRGYRVAYQSCPWRAAMSVAVHAASHSLRSALPPVPRAFSARRSSGAPFTSDAPVTARISLAI
jgi:hypothetical protein